MKTLLLSFITLATAASFVSSASAAISVGPTGSGTLTFGAAPGATEWSTGSRGTAAGNTADSNALYTAVITNVASAIGGTVGTETLQYTGGAGVASWNSANNNLQTRPTGVGFTLLMATLQNDSGGDLSSVLVTYTFGATTTNGTTIVEEIPGWLAFYSLSGAAGSWTQIQEFSTGTGGGLSARLNLGTWVSGTPLYLLWADDNAAANISHSGTEEGQYTLDNFAVYVPNAAVVTSPLEGQSFFEGVPFTVTAGAVMANPIVSVSFYENGNLIGVDATEPYSAVYSSPTAGPHSLTAVALDSIGNMTTSAGVNVTVAPNLLPSVSITNPTAGSSYFVGTMVTNVSASASDSDGTIVRVEFYLDGALWTSDTTSPYSFDLCDITVGSHTIAAVAVDNANGRATNSLSISATNPPAITVIVPNGSDWKYLDDGTDPGANWTTLGFSDAGWSNGIAELGYGDAPGRPERTTVGFGPSAAAKYPTTFFRKQFTVANPATFTNLIVRLLRDDGAIVYINGTDVFHSGVSNVFLPLTYQSNTPPAAADDGVVYQATNVNPTVLVAGLNQLAVEIHQDSPGSSDISFDLMLWGQSEGGPRLRITPTDATHADISWPFPSTGYILESKTDLNAASWDPVLEPDAPDASNHHVIVDTSSGKRFFRLRNPAGP